MRLVYWGMEKLSPRSPLPSTSTNQHMAVRTTLDLGVGGTARNKSKSGLAVPVWQPLSPAALLEPEPGSISNKVCQDLQFPLSLPPFPGSELPSQLLAWSSRTAACHFTVWHKVKDNRVYKKLCSLFFKIRWKQTGQMNTKG